MRKQGERRKGEEGRSLTSAFNEAMIETSMSCLEDDNECMVCVLYTRLGKTAVNSFLTRNSQLTRKLFAHVLLAICRGLL